MTRSVKMILTNPFTSDPRVLKEAIFYINNGYKVEVLAWDRECINRENDDLYGVKIKRFAVRSEYGQGIKKQLFAYLRFKKECKKYLKKEKFDILHCHDLDGAIVGLAIHKKNITKIFDMHEYYLTRNSKIGNLIMNQLVRHIQNKFNWIIFLNDKQKRDVKVQNINKLIFLPNYPEKKLFDNFTKTVSDKIRIGYVGSIRNILAFENLFKSIKSSNKLTVELYGNGVTAEYLKKYESENIRFYGFYVYSQLKDIYQNIDLMYCVYDNLKNDTYPVKYLEALAAHIPVIIDKNSIASKLIEKYDIGFLVDVNDFSTYLDLINKLENNIDIVGRKTANFKNLNEQLYWENVVNNLSKCLK